MGRKNAWARPWPEQGGCCEPYIYRDTPRRGWELHVYDGFFLVSPVNGFNFLTCESAMLINLLSIKCMQLEKKTTHANANVQFHLLSLEKSVIFCPPTIYYLRVQVLEDVKWTLFYSWIFFFPKLLYFHDWSNGSSMTHPIPPFFAADEKEDTELVVPSFTSATSTSVIFFWKYQASPFCY